jgi:hypothetical protein
MTGNTEITIGARVLGPQDGELMGASDAVRDRFMVGGTDSGGGFALLEHLMPPRALAAPLHRHSREDEYSYVLEGRVGALLGDEEVFGEAGDLISSPAGSGTRSGTPATCRRASSRSSRPAASKEHSARCTL